MTAIWDLVQDWSLIIKKMDKDRKFLPVGEIGNHNHKGKIITFDKMKCLL